MKITSIILHFNRQQNIAQVIDGIRLQSESSDIIVWDNSNNCPDISGVTIIRSQRNFNCQPRFWLSGMVDTEFVWTQDDDFKIVKPDLFSRLIDLSSEYNDCIIGVKGKVFGEWSDPLKPYQHNTGWVGEGRCDMVNTGLSFFRPEILNSIPLNPYRCGLNKRVTKEEYRYGDDMWVSSFLKCYAYDFFKQDVEQIQEGEQKNILSKQPEHMDVRNKLCKRYWL